MNLARAVVLGALVACSSPAQPSATSTVPPLSNQRVGSGSDGSGAARELKLIPHRKVRIAVLGFDAIAGAGGAPNPATVSVARDFTDAVRREAREDHDVTAVVGSRQLLDEKLMGNCDDEKPACMSPIGVNLGADQILFGHVEERGPVHFVVAKLVDVETKIEVQWTGTITAQAADIQAAAHAAYVTLVGQVQ